MYLIFFIIRLPFFIIGLIFWVVIASPFFILGAILWLLYFVFCLPFTFIFSLLFAAWKNDEQIIQKGMSEWYKERCEIFKKSWDDYWNYYYDLGRWLLEGDKK